MREFHQLFVGRTDAYGAYVLPQGQIAKRGTKFLGKAKTITNGNLTLANYQEHLDGTTSLGIVPIIPPEETVSWFVIDVDKYTDEDLHGKLAKQISNLNLPLVICNSKSGGAHLYCFLTEPAGAKDVRKIASQFVKRLNLDPKTEIFPKQDKSTSAGSWINLPYFGETRKCVGQDGNTELTLAEFLLFVEQMEVHPDDLEIRAKEIKQRVASGSKAPPCVDVMEKDGIEEGGRDNALTHVCIYLKKRYADDWQDRLAEFNAEHVFPPMSFGEVARIVRKQERTDYNYMCKHSPMSAMCDKTECFRREYGIGTGESSLNDFAIDSIRKIDTEDPIYVVVIDGLPVRIKTKELFSYPLFREEFFKQCNTVLMFMKPEQWKERLAEATANIIVETAPEITGESGQIRHHFREWTGRLITSAGIQRVLEGYPYWDAGTILFRGTDFLSYLKRQGVKHEDRMVWLVLSEDGAEQKRHKVGEVKRSLWCYPVGEPWFDPPELKVSF